jgi:hypothetical protein
VSDERLEEPGLETDPRFPSGAWTGFFLQPMLPGRHWMELQLTFRAGTLRGEGRDWVGHFLIKGRYDTAEGKCWWNKAYVGKHDVAYAGYNEGRGIWGMWELADPPWRGGFHIWPEGMDIGEDSRLEEQAEIPDRADPFLTFEDQEVESLEPAGAGRS